MKAPWSGQLSAAKAGWLIALLFFGWLAFLFMPAPKPEPKPMHPYIKPAPSRLVALGLPDNPDLEHLPEFFALYASQAEWGNDRTIFAYWNPGSNSYSYFFEALRANGSYRFKSMPEQIVGEDEFVQDGLYWAPKLSSDAPIRFIHRFDPPKIIIPAPIPPMGIGIHPDGGAPHGAQFSEPIKVPPPEMKLHPSDLEQKK